MKLALSVPFRTLFNLESELVAEQRKQAIAQLAHAFSIHNDSQLVSAVEIIREQLDDTKSGLMNLSQDHVPWFARAVASFSLSEIFVAQALSEFNQQSEGEFSPVGCGFSAELRVDVYDNTVAVASGSCELDPTLLPTDWDADDFELFLSKIGQALVAPVNNMILRPVLERLQTSAKTLRKGRTFLRPKNAFHIFSDVNSHPFPQWDDAVSPCFWTHRIYAPTDDERTDTEIRRLLRSDEIEQHGEKLKDGTILYVGSSLVQSPDNIPSLMKALSLSQFFYCLLDILNSSQNKIYHRLASVKARRESLDTFQQFNRMENFIDYVFNEIVDTELSLQSSRRMYFGGFGRVFGTKELVKVLREREKLVSTRVERKRHEIERNNRRTIQFSLFLLGSAQILTLFVELFDFVDKSPSGKLIGLADLIQWMDFNITFHVLSVMIILGALYATIRRQ